MVYITGDTHRDFDRIDMFCLKEHTSKNDTMIILGDAGINFYKDRRDDDFKKMLSYFPLTFFCIHGNHEERPYLCEGYEESDFAGAKVYINPEYPNQLFAKDGEIYTINGKKCLVIGGAYSIDKEIRLNRGYPWFESEQPDDVIKKRVYENLDKVSWKVHTVLTHTAPLKYEPKHMFIKGFDQSKVDKTTEMFLNSIEERLDYKKWYFGHYHGEWDFDRMTMLFTEIRKF